jgi:hypothetical protein
MPSAACGTQALPALKAMIADLLLDRSRKDSTRQDAVCSLRDAGAPRFEGNDC